LVLCSQYLLHRFGQQQTDGLGIVLWKKAGFKIGIITGDASDDTKDRAKLLKADYVYFNCMDKISVEDAMKKVGASVTKSDMDKYKMIEQNYLKSAKAALEKSVEYLG